MKLIKQVFMTITILITTIYMYNRSIIHLKCFPQIFFLTPAAIVKKPRQVFVVMTCTKFLTVSCAGGSRAGAVVEESLGRELVVTVTAEYHD